jgi:pimeloyl-ACP methyl ester carboxylesterase
LTKTLFLPGAGGRRSFWQPVADALGVDSDGVLLGWPGFGDEPPDPGVRHLSDLAAYALGRVDGEFNLVAQSMGGVVALQIALKAPGRVRGLVLCATSGGVDFGAVEREDWRPSYLREMPEGTPRWFVDDRTDLTPRLAEITAPALLICGSEDRTAPPEAVRRLTGLLPDARLEVIAGAGHDVAVTHAAEVAELVVAFLSEGTRTPALYLDGEGAAHVEGQKATRARLGDAEGRGRR